MKIHGTMQYVRAAAMLAVIICGRNLAQAQTCSATWTGNAGNGGAEFFRGLAHYHASDRPRVRPRLQSPAAGAGPGSDLTFSSLASLASVAVQHLSCLRDELGVLAVSGFATGSLRDAGRGLGMHECHCVFQQLLDQLGR